MGLFEDFSNFLESRLDDFLQSNPQLNLSFLEKEVKQEIRDNESLVRKLEFEQKNLEKKVVSLGKEVSRWYDRIEKAKQGGRLDLASAAEEKLASLLQQGNSTWHKMQTVKEKLVETKKLLVNLYKKQKDIQLAKQEINEVKNNYKNTDNTYNYRQSNYSSSSNYSNSKYDDLEAQFQKWEVEEELRNMKDNY